MRNHLFIDSLNALASGLETKVFHILTRSRKVSDKMETLTMELLDFKCALYQNIAAFVTECQQANSSQSARLTAQTLEGLKEEITANSDRLCRYRLHHILKNKAERQRRESMIASSLSVAPNEQLSQLEKSILLIEKDLGIEPEHEQNQKLGITRIINKSLFLGVDSTPVSKINPNDYSVISEVGSLNIDIPAQEVSQDMTQSFTKQNYQQNGKEFESEQKTLPKKPKILPKKKLNPAKSQAKEGLLGNLLQETYHQCLDKV